VAGATSSFGAGNYDFYLVKVNGSGTLLWSRTFGGSQNELCYAFHNTSDGGYILTGETLSFGAGGTDLYLVKTDADGYMVWNKTFGGTGYDLGHSVLECSDGGYVVAGTTQMGTGSRNVYLIKVDVNGSLRWSRIHSGLTYNYGYSVQQTSDGGYIIAGEASSIAFQSQEVYLVKTDADGYMVWNKTYGGVNNDFGYFVRQCSDGGYIVAGRGNSFGGGDYDFYLVRTNADGNMLWNKSFGGSNSDVAYSIQQTSDGGYIIAGNTFSFGAGDSDVYLVKTDADGNLEWNTTYGGTDYEIGFSVHQTTDGGYIVAGSSDSFGSARELSLNNIASLL